MAQLGNSNDWTYHNFTTTPVKTFDVVWCRFPFAEDKGAPGPKARPALVKTVLQKDNNIFIEIIYGTSSTKNRHRPTLYIANLVDMVDAGLPQATAFYLDKTTTLPWAIEFFEKRPDGTGPVIGLLNQKCKEYLQIVLTSHKY